MTSIVNRNPTVSRPLLGGTGKTVLGSSRCGTVSVFGATDHRQTIRPVQPKRRRFGWHRQCTPPKGYGEEFPTALRPTPSTPDVMPKLPPKIETYILTLGGRIRCLQCSAKSKRTGVQCRAVALKGKTKCRVHGGESTGPKTAAGKARVAAAHLVHGEATRAARAEYRAALVRLAKLDELGRNAGIISGPRTRGRKVKQPT